MDLPVPHLDMGQQQHDGVVVSIEEDGVTGGDRHRSTVSIDRHAR